MTAVGTALGIAIDRLLGEPPVSVHPVAHFGSIMQAVERRTYRDRRVNGFAHLLAGIAIAATAGTLTRRVLGRHASTSLAVAICAAGRMLDEEALCVADHLRQGDIVAARQRIRSLVGRNSDALDEAELARAVIESVAENLVDAVTATALSGAVAGSTGAFVHRAVTRHRTEESSRPHLPQLSTSGWAASNTTEGPARIEVSSATAIRPQSMTSNRLFDFVVTPRGSQWGSVA